MKFHRGDVVLINHPFSGGAGSKVRPTVIVQSDFENAKLTNTVVATITRNIHRIGKSATQVLIDVASPEGGNSGLLANSAVTCSNLFTVPSGG